MSTDQILAGVGPRLAQLRHDRGMTLGALARATGISSSTLSRLESGHRRASLELLLPITRAHGVTLDELVGTRPTEDPRVRSEPIRTDHMVLWPLSRVPGQPSAYKVVYAPNPAQPALATHEGYEWVYVLSGRLRLILGDQDIVMTTGEAAEFDTRQPHWLGCAGDAPTEALVLFGKQGERVHLRTKKSSGE